MPAGVQNNDRNYTIFFPLANFQVLFKLLPESEQLQKPRKKITSRSLYKAIVKVMNKSQNDYVKSMSFCFFRQEVSLASTLPKKSILFQHKTGCKKRFLQADIFIPIDQTRYTFHLKATMRRKTLHILYSIIWFQGFLLLGSAGLSRLQ